MPLGTIRQEDFSAGQQRDVAPHLIDPRGVFAIGNGLLDDDGSIYKRGGSRQVAPALSGGLRSVWDGWLRPGRRTFVAGTAQYGALNLAGTGLVNLGGTGQTVPLPARAIQDLLFVGGGLIYGGSRMATDYSTGSVTVTNGSTVVVGAGTAWLANVDAGMLFRIPGENRLYVVAAVTSDTVLSIRDAYEGGTAAGSGYTLKRLEAASAPYKPAQLYAVAGKRLLVGNGNTVDFSEPNKPHRYQATIAPLETVVDNKHELEEGTTLIAMESLGVDEALLFHTRGVTAISNLAASIVDGLGASQHRIDKLSADLIAWGPAGITGWRNSLVVPGMDNVYLMDGSSSPTPISHSINRVYQAYVLEGFSPGQAWTFKDHYFLPILDATGAPQDLLCCRLDRPFESRGQTLFPWGFHSGAGAKVSGAAVRSTSTPGDVPAVYGAASDGKLLDLATYFNPNESVKNDHDGSTALFSIVTRDFPAGDLAIGRFRKLRLLYAMEADDEEVPLITAEVGTGIRREPGALWDDVDWDEFLWAASDEETQFELLEGGAPPNGGSQSAYAQNAWVWRLKTRARYARFRLQLSDPVAKLTVRSLEVFVARTGGVRQSKVVDY